MSLHSRKIFKVLPVVSVPPIDASDGAYPYRGPSSHRG